MSSPERPPGGNSVAPRLPCSVGRGIMGGSWFFGSGSSSGGVRGTDEGASLGALRSSWISRLRPPPGPTPGPRPLFLASAQKGTTAAAAEPARGGGVVYTHEPRTRARTPGANLGRRYTDVFQGGRPPPPLGFSPRRISPDAAAAASYSSHMLQRQQRGTEAEQGQGRGELARGEENDRRDRAAGFGPFQVRAKRARLALVEKPTQQQGHSDWTPESEKVGDNRRSCRPMADVLLGTGRGNYRSFVGDGCFPFLQRMTRLGVVRGEVGEVAERDDKMKELLAEEEGGGVSTSPVTGHPDDVDRNGCPPREASFFRQRGTLCMSPNVRVPSNVGSDSAARSSQAMKNDRWLHRSHWVTNSNLLDHDLTSSSWPVGHGSITGPEVSGSSVCPRGLVGESRRRLRDQHFMASAQGSAFKGAIDDTATNSISYDIPNSNELVQQQFVIKSSFWKIKRVERAHMVSSFCPSLPVDKGVGRKRILDSGSFIPINSQKLRTWD